MLTGWLACIQKKQGIKSLSVCLAGLRSAKQTLETLYGYGLNPF